MLTSKIDYYISLTSSTLKMSYNVYLVEYSGWQRNHHVIFVETHEDGEKSGYIYQVSGNIQQGMSYEHKKAKRPENSKTYDCKRLLGTVTIANYPYIRGICDSIPPPKKQFNGTRQLYPNEPLRRCQEWTAEAIQALTSQGILQASSGSVVASSSSSEFWTWSDQYQRFYHKC